MPLVNVCSTTRMRTLWLRMAEIYGHRWTSAYGEDAALGAGNTWEKGLSDCSPKQLANGLSAALVSADPWPPTLPQFRAMCLDIPSLASVVLIIRGRAEPTPFARLVLSHIDSYRLRSTDAEKADRIIRDAYEMSREYVMAGGKLADDPVAAIEHDRAPTSKPADPAVAREHLDRIAALLKIEPVKPHTEVDA